jgi:hypothetical protein
MQAGLARQQVWQLGSAAGEFVRQAVAAAVDAMRAAVDAETTGGRQRQHSENSGGSQGNTASGSQPGFLRWQPLQKQQQSLGQTQHEPSHQQEHVDPQHDSSHQQQQSSSHQQTQPGQRQDDNNAIMDQVMDLLVGGAGGRRLQQSTAATKVAFLISRLNSTEQASQVCVRKGCEKGV